jgi:hypothetical protein
VDVLAELLNRRVEWKNWSVHLNAVRLGAAWANEKC